jgi:NTE family protein
MANADLAQGYERVLVIAPLVDSGLGEQLAALNGRSQLIQPDQASLAAFGADLLDPGVRAPAAHAGRGQGVREAPRIAALWR